MKNDGEYLSPLPKCENIGYGGGWQDASRRERRTAVAFQSRDFRLYQTARLMVILGAEAQSVAVAWQVYAITHSALDLGYTGLALFLPGVFVMLAAGHVADRYDRRKIILLCYGLQAICTATLLWLSLSATALEGRQDVADLCGAGGNWIGQGVQRAGGERDVAQPGAEGRLCQCGDVGRDGLSDCEYVGAGGGWNAVYASAGGHALRRGMARRGLCVYAVDAARISSCWWA